MLPSLLYLFVRCVIGLFRSGGRSAADAGLEVAVLRHQLAVLRRQVKRPVYRTSDRAFLAAASRALSREDSTTLLTRHFAAGSAHRLPTRAHRGEKPGRVAHLHTSPHVSGNIR